MTNDPIPPPPGEPPYEPPPYTQSPYGQQQPPPVQPPAGGKDNTQLYGILGIVLGIITCPPLGILFGWLSIKEAREHGQSETLGKVALWIGIVYTGILVLAAICGLGAVIIGSSTN